MEKCQGGRVCERKLSIQRVAIVVANRRGIRTAEQGVGAKGGDLCRRQCSQRTNNVAKRGEIGLAWKQRQSRQELGSQTANCPDIHPAAVGSVSDQ